VKDNKHILKVTQIPYTADLLPWLSGNFMMLCLLKCKPLLVYLSTWYLYSSETHHEENPHISKTASWTQCLKSELVIFWRKYFEWLTRWSQRLIEINCSSHRSKTTKLILVQQW
jgi:hypothetical protein